MEKEEDVCCGTSKANSAIIHAGYDAQEGSLMAKLNVWAMSSWESCQKIWIYYLSRSGRGSLSFGGRHAGTEGSL